MLKDMNPYRLVWKSTFTRKQKVDRYYSLVVARALWGIHLITLLPPNLAYLEYVHERCLGRILNRKSAYWSRISNEVIRRLAAAATLTSSVRFRQLIYLGKLLRKDAHHPDRLACFQPRTDLRPRQPAGIRHKVGRPRKLLAEMILPLCETHWNKMRAEILQLAQDERAWHARIEDLSRRL